MNVSQDRTLARLVPAARAGTARACSPRPRLDARRWPPVQTTAAREVVAIRFAVAFAALIAVGELLLARSPGGPRGRADVDPPADSPTRCSSWSARYWLGMSPVFQVVAVTGLGMILGTLLYLAVGRPARRADRSSKSACGGLRRLFPPAGRDQRTGSAAAVGRAGRDGPAGHAGQAGDEIFLSACIRAANLGARFWVMFTDELHVQGPLGVAVGASAMLIKFAGAAIGLLAVVVFIALGGGSLRWPSAGTPVSASTYNCRRCGRWPG